MEIEKSERRTRKMYYCYNCRSTFDEPVKIVDTHGWFYPPYETYWGCPECGGWDIEEREEEE